MYPLYVSVGLKVANQWDLTGLTQAASLLTLCPIRQAFVVRTFFCCLELEHRITYYEYFYGPPLHPDRQAWSRHLLKKWQKTMTVSES
jgi:hypothetical protein